MNKSEKEPMQGYRASDTDPQGSWTGIPENPWEPPVQDADDL